MKQEPDGAKLYAEGAARLSVRSNIEFGDRKFLLGSELPSDNSTDALTCESLLEMLHEAQSDSKTVLSSVELALVVILERIVGDGR